MRGALIISVLLALGACASAQAKGSADKPALDVPPPPPHVVELPAQPLEPVGEIPNPGATATGAPRAPRPAPPKPEQAKPAEIKPDNPPGQATAPAETPPPAPSSPAPAPQLRTPQTADTTAAARKVRATIDSAKSSLATVNYGPLSNDRKKAYNDAKLFIQQAEDALKEGNIVFAQAVATKAETLARELAGG